MSVMHMTLLIYDFDLYNTNCLLFCTEKYKPEVDKGNKVELTTFNNWGKASIIGYKTEEENGKTMVNYIQ